MKHIISPHIDDAVFSIGGLLSHYATTKEPFDVQYLFTISDWINPDALDSVGHKSGSHEVTRLRKDEEAKVSAELGFKSFFMDLLDFPLREFQPDIVNIIVSGILNGCSEKDPEFFLPLGLVHPDHVLMREVTACLLRSGRRVSLYEDLPYASNEFSAYQKRADAVAKAGFKPHLQPIDIHWKLRLARYYRSQTSAAWLESIRSFAYHPDEVYYERYWSCSGNADIDML